MRNVYTVEELWCDGHGGREVEATTTVAVSLDGADPVELDVCEECDKELFGRLRDLMTSAGRRTVAAILSSKTSKVIDEEYPCRLCDAIYSGKQTLAYHIWRVHVGSEKPKQPRKCPECGILFDKPFGMGRHRATMHGFDILDEAYAAIAPAPKRKGRSG